MDEYLYLLDTNIISNLIRFPSGNAASRISAAGEEYVCTSIVVACELRFGGEKKQFVLLSERDLRRLSEIASDKKPRSFLSFFRALQIPVPFSIRFL